MFKHKSYLTADEIIIKLLESDKYFDLVKNQIDIDSMLVEGALSDMVEDLDTTLDYNQYKDYIELEILQINETNFKHTWVNTANDLPILISFCNN